MGADTRGISIPGFELVEELGRGARSAVYRARRGGADYAVKVQDLSGPGGAATSQGFRREAAIIAALRHPCLGQVYEVGEAARHAYMVMELIEGRTLADLLADGPITETQTVDIASDVASALAAAHRVGVVHRDIKPRNIVVGRDGHAKVIDFGLATPTGVTLEDTVAGTVLYMAPEQAGMVRRPVDGRSDLYALGAVLFECLAGRPLFEAAEAGEVARLHAVAPAPDLREVRRDVSPGIARIVARLLAKDPDDRYQSAEALLGDFSRLARGALDENTPLGLADEHLQGAGDTPLVGRTAELGLLLEALAEARQGAGAAVVVESEPGGGRTRLVAEATRLARFQHVAVLEGRCVASSPVPFAPLRQAVDNWLRSLERRELRERVRLREALRLSVGQLVEPLRGFTPALDELLAVQPAQVDLAPQETTGAALVQLLVTIARVSRGAVLVVDGVHAADDATRRVLQRLAAEIGRSKLLVVLTARNDPANRAIVTRLLDELGPAVRFRIELPRLGDDEIAEMLAGHLGGGRLDEELARELTLRSNGNAAAAIEYLRAALDGGVIRPSWGSFVVDRPALARLDLPSDVLQLELRRLESLDPAARDVLAAAAVVGARFDVELASAVSRRPASEVRDLFGEAQRARLLSPVESPGGEQWSFLHDTVREALLANLDPGQARRYHELAARALEAAGDSSPGAVFEMANHFALGEVKSDPVAAFQANYHAARVSAGNDAIDEALRFFGVADTIAEDYGLTVPTEFHEDYGNAGLRARLLELARGQFERALVSETDRRARSRLYEAISRVHYANADTDRVLETIQLALAEIGGRFPSHPVTLVLNTLWRFAAGIACTLTRIGFGRARPLVRERFRTEVRLLDLAGQAAYQNLNNRLVLIVAMRSLYPVSRLGPSREYVALYSSLSALLSIVGLRPLSRFIAMRVRRMARRLGDPAVELHTRVNEALSLDFEGHPLEACDRLQALLRDHGRYLDPIDYQLAVAVLCIGLALRGYIHEESLWYEEAARRMHLLEENRNVSAVAYLGIAVAGVAGQPSIGLERIAAVERVIEALGGTRSMVAAYYNSLALFHFGLGELGEPFEDAVAGFATMRIRPMTAPLYYRPFWIVKAFARLSQAAVATPEDRKEALRRARRALVQLRLTGRTPVLRGHFFVALAYYHYLRGRQRQALRVLRRADRHTVSVDAPALEMEGGAVRSLVLGAMGHEAEARRLNEGVRRYADILGVQSFVRWIRPSGSTPIRPPSPGRPIGPVEDRRLATAETAVTSGERALANRPARRSERQLSALLQVSAAAARTLDPEELARIALDETVRILGAERALLFLAGESGHASRPHLGRDSSGHDLVELTGYSTTIVDRVQATREAIVLTGTEEGAALGSESAVAHGLRSILVAPLQLEDRLLGVVYLDNRLAKGVFTTDDVEILAAITNHVAIALETARLAHVELSVQAERNQREIAEMLRDSMHKVSQSLEPEEVLRSILSTARLVLGADGGAILLLVEQKLRVACALGTPAGAKIDGTAAWLDLGDEPEIARVVTKEEILTSGDVVNPARTPVADVIGHAGSWVAVPLVVREVPIGALVLATRAPGAYGSGQAEIAAALAGQGVVAYENARLFAQVQTLAQIDELSGVATRRHFFELGSQAFANARRYDRPLSTIMLDIDYFKLVNDRHGHASGDDVIRAVASRIAASIRAGDVLGRLGGEEFALVLHENLDGAIGLAERLRTAVSDAAIGTSSGPVRVTISVGVATLHDDDASLSRLLQRTDLALYEAKRSGRNRVCVDDATYPAPA